MAVVFVAWAAGAAPATTLGVWLLVAVVSNLQMAAWGETSNAIYALAAGAPLLLLALRPAHGFAAVAAGCAGVVVAGLARSALLRRASAG